MYDGKKIDLDQTNLMNFGSELEIKIKKAASEGEIAWKSCKEKKGVKVWRIEKFCVIPWPENDYGNFYNGDSYIILHIFEKEKGEIKYHINMWLGSKTSVDEAGTAAYKTVELNDYLDRKAILFREVEGYESDLFLSYFTGRINILEGGIESGFKKIPNEIFLNRLLRVIYKNKQIRVVEVKLSSSSLNKNDVFILDNGLTIYKWIGSKASSFEKFKAEEICKTMDSSRKDLPEIVTLEENTDCSDFWNLLGGKGEIKESCNENLTTLSELKLYKISDKSGRIVCEEISSGSSVKKNQLKNDDVYFLLHGYQISIWIGSKASSLEVKYAIPTAENFLKEAHLPSNFLISCYQEGNENKTFFSCFNE